ncbi:MAG: Crp/Fnr family transcriptional regulator [Firmicutes bacterium]|nr:Crp/Fnr family transcriptional regulator [Bacillota bacterium]
MRDYDLLRRSPLFQNMSDPGIDRALKLFQAQEARFRRGQYLCHAGEPMSRFGFVLKGAVHVFIDDVNGERFLMNSVGAGDSFGESLHFMEVRDSPIYIMAVEDTRLLWLNARQLKEASRTTETLETALRFVALLAQRALTMNDRIQILTQTSIRSKLNLYFAQCANRCNSRTFTIGFNRNQLADHLAVNRSALSRELSRMKQEGLIDYHLNSFTIRS